MKAVDPKKLQEELDKEQAKMKPGWAYNKHYTLEFMRICKERKWKYGEIVDKMIKDFVHKMNPKFK